MYKNSKVAVVVPAYNEEDQILKVIDHMHPCVDQIIIVNDASTDKTKQIIEERSKTDTRVVLISHSVNQGVGGAIATGYKWARDHNFDVAAVMAGDHQMDSKDLPDLLDPVVRDEADYTKANRLIYENSYAMIPKKRFWGNAILSLMTKIASGYWHVSDSQTGYTVINLKALKTIDWDQMYKRYGQPNDLLVRLNVWNFRVRDVPLKPVYNVGETSKLKISRVIFPMQILLTKLFFWRLFHKYVVKDFHPLILFYFYGFTSLIISFIFFLRFMWRFFLTAQFPETSLLILLFCFGGGMQAIFFAMWLDQNSNKELR